MITFDPRVKDGHLFFGLIIIVAKRKLKAAIISGDTVLKVSTRWKLTRYPHGVVIDFLFNLSSRIHSVKIITLYETTK